MDGYDDSQERGRERRQSPAWVSTREAAEQLGVSLRTVYRLIDGGELAAYQIGRNIRVKEVDLERYLDSRKIAPGALRHLYSFESVEEDV